MIRARFGSIARVRAGLDAGLGAVPAVVSSQFGRIGALVTVPTAHHHIVADRELAIVIAAGAS